MPYRKFIRAAYKHFDVDYPKFFKMDGLSKLGFLSAEVLLADEKLPDEFPAEKTGFIIFNASSSLEIDEKHQSTISNREAYFPSPSNFVYTLPNIMAGEAAIRHKIKGENTVLISEHFDAGLLHVICEMAFANDALQCCIGGWVEQYGDDFESILFLICREENKISVEGVIFEPSTLNNLYKKI
ncbi:MAG TPA: hypothetical protein VK994_01785 [Bacteroidales bacterium]|nr:hypothetical protein [Bacteroidales bacterium]